MIRRLPGPPAVATLLTLAASFSAPVAAQQPAPPTADVVSTREMDRINWMEFRDVVPERVRTVLLPVGTLEPHGVANNGADNTAPTAMAHTLARRVNAMIAPTLPYGITGSMAAYPGAFGIDEAAYRPFIKQVLEGLAKNGFRNIVVLNGHGGGQTAVLNAVAAEVAAERGVRTLVVNWWSFASDVTKAVFGEDGGHAGWNETAFIQAIDSTLVHPGRYSAEMATAYPAPGTWSASPFPSSIGLYQAGQGYPRFDQAKANEYYRRVVDKVGGLIEEVVRKWEMAGLRVTAGKLLAWNGRRRALDLWGRQTASPRSPGTADSEPEIVSRSVRPTAKAYAERARPRPGLAPARRWERRKRRMELHAPLRRSGR